MATMLLVPVMGSIGASLIPGTFMGIGIGAAIGQVVGGLAGAYIDNWLFGSSGQKQISEGPRLDNLRVTSSTEGQPIPRVYGRARLGGVLIWATNFEEVRTEETQGGSGGKSMGGGGGDGPTVVTYKYYCSFAVAICEGPITKIGKVWADSKEMNIDDYAHTIYLGTDTQNPDPHIESKQPGTSNVPAYRGVAYIVFNRMLLEKFGNRIPQFNFEVFKSVDNFEETVKALSILPASGDFVYSPTKYTQNLYQGLDGEQVTRSINVNTRRGGTDWTVAMRDMQASFKNLANTSLIVAWFGDDLRCGNCTLRPKVDTVDKDTLPTSWLVSGVNRAGAQVITQSGGTAAYGSTPDDKSVYDAIQDLTARGLPVTFYPFIMMDVPAGNTLPNPYGGTGQPVYPWRGRITCNPAPGVGGTVDKTAAAATQVSSFVGSCLPAHFTASGSTISYSGPAEWSFRRFILHYAKLCAAAGGVNTFIIGTELRGLTWIRSAQFVHPFVTALKTLAADVSTILPSAKILYGADWSEFTPYQTPDGELDFHLDPLWSDTNIDAIGIDCYWPLSDWRQGTTHLDKLAGNRSVYDIGYLKSNVQGGEGYNWYYANDNNRDDQIRNTITDTTHGKPWVYRYKDVKGWWSNQHKNRVAGTETGAFTAWVPESKPIWFTELGCPAVNLGANQPNVFYDPKSSESFFPYYSSGARDDFMQRQYIRAFCEFWDHTHAEYIANSNPVSGVYGGRMVDINRIYVYTWDARPFPTFPYSDVWGDGPNWQYGHWLTGRVAGGALVGILRAIMEDYNFASYDVSGLSGYMDGYVIDRIMSVRDAIQPLEVAFFFDSFESDGLVKMRHRGALGSQRTLTIDDLVEESEGNLYEITRGQETELPLSAKVMYSDSANNYQSGSVEARRLTVLSSRVSTANLPIVMRQSMAQPIADILLQENWVSREKAKFALPPSMLYLEPTDVVVLNVNNNSYRVRLINIADHGARTIEAHQIDASIYDHAYAPDRPEQSALPQDYGTPAAFFMNLPMLSDYDKPQSGYLATYLDPFPGGISFFRSPTTTNYTFNVALISNATIGKTLFAFYNGPEDIYDNANQLIVKLFSGELSSVPEEIMLAGANAAAVRNADGEWEVLQFMNAELIDVLTYKLTVLRRGQLGTERHMRAPVAAGAPFVLLTSALKQVVMQTSDIGTPYNWKFGPSNRDIADDSYVTKTAWAFNGMGYKCYSPVQPKLVRNVSNSDLVLSWVRRTRIGGDNWDATEVPLGEEYEKYEVDIYNGSTVVATITTNTTSCTFTGTQQVAYFGIAQSQLDVAIYQVNSYGRGHARRGFVYVSGAF